MIGFRDREDRGEGFSVTVTPKEGEHDAVTRGSDGATLSLDGRPIGKRGEGVEVHIPQQV
jgi:hypothetical protein